MKRTSVLFLSALLTVLALAACGRGAHKLIDGSTQNAVPTAPPANPHTGNPADPGTPGDPGKPAPATPVSSEPPPPTTSTTTAPGVAPSTPTTPSPDPSLPRYETYQFDGFVIADGTYPASVQPGDRVSGTFRIDFEQPVYATNGEANIYRAFDGMQGTIGSTTTFTAGQDYLYVEGNAQTPFFADTAHLTLDGQPVNFDFYFFIPADETPFPNDDLSNVRHLDQRAYRRIVLWFETDPRTGGGFNADIYSVKQAADVPAIARR